MSLVLAQKWPGLKLRTESLFSTSEYDVNFAATSIYIYNKRNEMTKHDYFEGI